MSYSLAVILGKKFKIMCLYINTYISISLGRNVHSSTIDSDYSGLRSEMDYGEHTLFIPNTSV